MDILAAYALALASSGMLWKGKKMDLQKEVDAFIQKPAYGLSHAEKSVRYAKMLSAATQYHREKCPEYGRFIRALGCPEGSFFVKASESAGRLLGAVRRNGVGGPPSEKRGERSADALQAGDLWEMNAQMQQVILQCASGFDSGTKPSEGTVQSENFFHGLTLGMLTCLAGDYHVSSNRESGFGRYDITLEPIDRNRISDAMILEFKVFSSKSGDQSLEDTARRARGQIDEKNYDTELFAKGFSPDEIRKYWFGFRGKEVMIVS